MNRIKELPKSSSHLLSSTQIITSAQSVVKELIENGFDSLAQNIEVKLEDFGLEKIEVKDNGSGIHKDDIPSVAKPHCTSKITSHSDLTKVDTYGFRGEALAALCAVSDLVITTRTANEEFGFTYIFDHHGNVLSSKPCPCNQGTSVTASNLFKNIPVRKQFYRLDKNKKDELKKIEDILIAFGCILTGVRLTLYHNRNLIWQKSAVTKIIDGLRLALGNVVDHMENCEYVDENSQIKIEVFLPRYKAPLSCGLTSPNRSIVAINKRPVRMKTIDKLLKEYYSKSLDDGNKSRYPICYVSIKVPSTDIDVNYEPNKTTVIMYNIDVITEQLSKLLNTFYDTNSNNDTNSNPTKGVAPTVNLLPAANMSEQRANNFPDAINQENSIPNFHLKESQLSCGFQNNNSKEKLALPKKLSRNNDFKTPSSKKVRTSSDFSTPPNDIYQHINTLESFFTYATDNTNAVITSSCTNELDAGKANENVVSIGNPDVNKNGDKHFSSINQSPMIVTVARGSVPRTEDGHLVEGSTDTVNNEQVTVNVMETPAKKGRLVDPSVAIIKKFNEVNKDSNAPSINSEHQNLDPVSTNKNSSSSNLIMIKEDVHMFETHENLLTTNERVQDKTNRNSVKSTPLIATNGWSRGLHPVETIQPVAVLRPKAVGDVDTSAEVANATECLNKEDPCSVTLNQRKITPFDFFCRKNRLEVASLNPGLSNQRIAQILTEKWSHLSPEKKAFYKNMVSKDYPKNIKNKDKLGPVVSQNLSNVKGKSSKSKEVVKKKRVRTETSIVFTMQMVQELHSSHFVSNSLNDDEFKLINCLAPGIWMCLQKDKLYLLNCFRLQEAIIYYRLLDTYEFEAEPLESSFILSASSLGSNAMDVISQMNVTNEFVNECIISDKRLAANGFKLRILQDMNDMQIEVIGMTTSMAFYGVPDLKEILSCIKEKGITAKLSDCRPGKAVLYLQGEAVRIARQSPASKSVEDVEDLLKKINSLPCKVCVHSKPFFHEVYNFSASNS